jgi:sulfite reductase (NADPH) flavoprotein alpha-component
MAKDVEAALLTVIQAAGGRTEEQASEYLESLQTEGRYQKDVY